MDKTNCPNCGMPIVGEKCEYCGTVFIDFACIDTDKPFYIKVRHGNRILRAKVISNLELNIYNNNEKFYANNKVYSYGYKESASMDIHLDFLEDEICGRRCLYEVIDTDKVNQETLKEVFRD